MSDRPRHTLRMVDEQRDHLGLVTRSWACDQCTRAIEVRPVHAGGLRIVDPGNQQALHSGSVGADGLGVSPPDVTLTV